MKTIRRWAPAEPVIHIDDSDVIKPEGYHFEALGVVRDGSKSTKEKSIYCKGYHVTEACILTTSGHPVSLYSQLHSSAEKSFTSVNDITFTAVERGTRLFGKATYVMDREYDDNKIFNKLTGLGQDYVIRLTKKRKLFYNGKWIPATELCAKRKGKVKMTLRYKGQDHEAYLSHVKVQVTASKLIITCFFHQCLSIGAFLFGAVSNYGFAILRQPPFSYLLFSCQKYLFHR